MIKLKLILNKVYTKIKIFCKKFYEYSIEYLFKNIESIKNFLNNNFLPFFAKYVVRWILKSAGSIICYLGVTEDQLYKAILGFLIFLCGACITILIDKKK
jgi:hypothetical protein